MTPSQSNPKPFQPKILVIEDHPATRSLVKMILEPEGYSVTFANDGDMGIEMAMSDLPQLVIVDIMMKNVSGWDVIKTLRADARFKRIPILVCTVKNSPVDMDMSMRLGAGDHLVKPFEPKVLREKVKRLLLVAETAK
ncbi:MAG: response regulator transcription factor [Elusimicrobia bacterium]|nr:response regulator transcription factor [Elusimicrobiota bacterium]